MQLLLSHFRIFPRTCAFAPRCTDGPFTRLRFHAAPFPVRLQQAQTLVALPLRALLGPHPGGAAPLAPIEGERAGNAAVSWIYIQSAGLPKK